METAPILLQQVLIMFLLAAVGFIAFRSGKISNEGSKTIGKLLICVSLPAAIIKGFLAERTTERIVGLRRAEHAPCHVCGRRLSGAAQLAGVLWGV